MSRPPAVSDGLPGFLVAGAMRSGTTSLYRYLGDHPEVFLVPKELQFFTARFGNGLEWYRAQFRPAGDHQILGEATADYFARRTAMDRIAAVLPEIRLIVSLRDPVGRAWSHYWLLRNRGRETRPFAAAVDDEMTAIALHGDNTSGAFYLYHSLYDTHLERAYRLLPREQVYVSIFERMVTDPATSYRSICTFLDIDPTFQPRNLGEPVNAYVTFRSLRARRLSQRLPVRAGRVVARLNTRRNVTSPRLEGALREQLDDFFAPRIRRLESMLGDGLPEWTASTS